MSFGGKNKKEKDCKFGKELFYDAWFGKVSSICKNFTGFVDKLNSGQVPSNSGWGWNSAH